MAQFFTDKYLKYRAALQGRPITADKPCGHCGYNLRGLRYGGVCPECGTPILYRRDTSLAFHEMPLSLIRKFRVTAWMATVAIGGTLAVLVGGSMMPGPPGTYAAALLGLILLWVVAAWRLTEPLAVPQAVAHGLSKRSRLRQAARWSQGGWLLAAAAPVLVGVTPGLGLVMAASGVVAGVIGVAALAMYLARFSHWVGDEFAAKAFNLAVFGTPFGAVGVVLLLLVVSSWSFFGFLGFLLILLFAVPIVLMVAVSILAFPVGLLSLSRSVDWSVVHARDRAQRSRELHERLVPRPAPRPAPPDPIELAEPSADPPPSGAASSTDPGRWEGES